ncbi:MAG: DUF4364 family protein [Ruminococcus sp.]|jgi:hypothetical protein|nr:DUF4364 family protein [Ruminococcus sp.]
MAFDTFDEGINYGGVRSKNEIRTLICYLFASIGKPMDKNTVVEVIQNKGLANYFETSSCFDDLIHHKNIELVDFDSKTYYLTDNGKMVATQLESTLPLSVKEKAYTCALQLLEQRRIEKENAVTITRTDKGYNVNCRISGGDVDLVSIDIYAPDSKQAKLIKKNFHKNPGLLYKVIMASITQNEDMIDDSLSELKKEIQRKKRANSGQSADK